MFYELYGTAFPKNEIEIKSTYLKFLCIYKGLQKSSKRKRRLYENFLNMWTIESEKSA